MLTPMLLQGFFLGWSVAWPPGPINAEMIRRGLERGFLPAWSLGLGACTGDFAWAVAVSLGAGVLIDVPGVRPTLGVVSVALLLFLAWTFGRGAWRAWQAGRSPADPAAVPARRFDSARGGYVLGLTLALTSPWNIVFWLGVIGSQAGGKHLGPAEFLTVAVGVFVGAAIWGAILCTAVRMGARFATPTWHVITQGATSLLMLYFAVLTGLATVRARLRFTDGHWPDAPARGTRTVFVEGPREQLCLRLPWRVVPFPAGAQRLDSPGLRRWRLCGGLVVADRALGMGARGFRHRLGCGGGSGQHRD